MDSPQQTTPASSPAAENAARVVWTLAWPAVALNSLQVVNTLLDRGFIGHLEGAALTAHGGAINIMFLMFSLAMALGTATTAIVSRAFGAGKYAELKEATSQALGLSFLCAVAFGVAGWLLAPAASQALLPKGDVRAHELMVDFLGAYAAGLPAIYLVQALAGAMRGVGDTRSPMVISGVQILLHIVFNAVLIFPPQTLAGGIELPGFGLGLVGAAVALSASAWVAAIAYLAYSGRTAIGHAWRIGAPSLGWYQRILRIAVPAAFTSLLRVGSLAAFTMVLARTPNASAAVAAMSVGFAIESIMFMPAFGLSMAAASLVGQSLGMKRPDRAERLGWLAGHHSAIVTGVVSVPIFLAAPWIGGIMSPGKPEIVAEASNLIRTLCVTEVFFGYAMTMMGAMQGAGDTRRPLWITVICMWGLRVPLAWLLALPLAWGPMGGWVAMSFSQLVQGVLSIIAFKKGAWKTQRV